MLTTVMNIGAQLFAGGLFFLVVGVVGKFLYDVFFTDAILE
jgi:hypothetical protein